MGRLGIIFAFTTAAFVVQSALRDLPVSWFRPNLLLLTVVFFNLFRGIRCSLAAAVCGGMLADAFSVYGYGQHTFALVACAYGTTFLKMAFYHPGSAGSRLLLVGLMGVCQVLLQFLVRQIWVSIPFMDMVRHVLIPEVGSTLAVTPYMMRRLRTCASRFFV